jgi:arylsulfatase A-like enzyme
MKKLNVILFAFCAALTIPALAQQSKPNIVVILADDMGFSDVGCYGSEIATPNIDRIAANGVRLRQFYNVGRCCPTRASLLTGLYPHNTGMGYMTGYDQHIDGYKGDLNKNCVTIAEALKPAGYKSYMSGKWHLCANIRPKGDQSNWPVQRGFDRYFGILQGSGSYFTPKTLTSQNTLLTPKPGFYLTDAIADSASAFISDHAAGKTKAPFFLYAAFTAPHWPLHAKQADIDKYMKLYEQGWDKLREMRYKRQLQMGIIDKSVRMSPREDSVKAWSAIPASEKAIWIKRMAVYAAQVDCMDQGVGRILATLKKNGMSDNTMVIFMADNGACAEFESNADKTIETLGSDASFESYRGNWANLSNTPFRLYKTRVHEGGTHAPFIISWPGHTATNGTVLDNAPVHMIDLLPTFLTAAGGTYPSSYNNNKINPVNGINVSAIFKGQAIADRPLYWEHQGNRAIRVKDWKMVSKSTEIVPYIGPWELYDLSKDKTELNDLAAKDPAKVKELAAMWDKWAAANNVLPLNGTDLPERKKQFDRVH